MKLGLLFMRTSRSMAWTVTPSVGIFPAKTFDPDA